MTKLKAPLFSINATGTLDKNITYKGLRQNHIAQQYSKPGDKTPFESSPRQKDQRSIIRLITIHWQCMSSSDKLSWEVAAKDKRFKGSGYHYFLHMAQQNLTQYLGLVGYWSMNYNIADKIPDLSGNSNHGTLDPIYPCDSPTLVDSFDKKHGKAARFDGINDYINCGLGLSLDTFTLEAFLNSHIIIPATQTIISKSLSYDNRNYYFFLSPSPRVLNFKYSISGSSIACTPGNTPLDINKYYHVAITYDKSHIIIYLNGEPDISPFSETGTFDTPAADTLLGSVHITGAPFLGELDDVRIYNRALSPEEIQKHYSSLI